MSRQTSMITINFSGTDYRLVHRVRAILFAFAAVLGIGAAVLAGLGASYRSKAGAMTREMREVQAAGEKMLPALQEREQLAQNLGQMASLVEARRLPWTRLLTAIEEVFPSGVALDRLEFDPRERVVDLEGEARSPEALSELMIGLQRTEMLKNPLLKRQSMEKGTLTFHVTVNYQEALATGPAPRAVRRSGR